MTLFEKIQQTAKQRGLSIRALNEKAQLGTNAIYKWKTQTPSTDKLKAVADVLGVSVDYLLGNTDKMHPTKKDGVLDLREVSDEERYELVSAGGRPITDEDWAIIKAVLAKYPRKED
ncbi:helix-turn-helix domain-containing protein [Weissella bombi]|uniref:helix-turn-helix domain-containing protein n=1 Tax=Weissella bombi TaxID=1505725 RepID=UPI003AF2164C